MSPMKRVKSSKGVLAWVLSLCIACAWAGSHESDFVSLFDGKTLKGWHTSAKTVHSRTTGNKSGGLWIVEDSAIVGSQDVPGNGGLVLTDEEFGDFEVVLEMNNDYGPDSGLFLRSTEDGKAYQAMIDYHAKGNLMGIFGEGLDSKPILYNFIFLDDPGKIKERGSLVPLPVLPDAGLSSGGTVNE